MYSRKELLHLDIAAMSIGLNQAKVTQEVKMSVMKMVMDSAKEEVVDLAKIMETSNNSIERLALPHLGNNVDIII